MQTATERLQAEIEAAYRQLTPASAELYERAKTALPGGDTRQSVFFRPYPLFVDGGQGAYVTDADGNRFLDCSNCWSAMILGHAHPSVVAAVTRQVALGTAFAAANRQTPELAELIKERLPSIEKLRFANSGTEATMFCVRAARAFTGRPKIVKMRGAYHGSHDDFEVSGGEAAAGIMPGAAEGVLEVEFNDAEAIARLLEEHGDEVAAVIVEGLLGSAGMLTPASGYLQHLREQTERHGTLLILDEVISLRLSAGGAQALYGVRPDLTALGKIIGGGFPVGAFGGRADLLEQFSPLGEHPLHHSGTFNANPVTMAAGIATMRELDADSFGYLGRLGERFAGGIHALATKHAIAVQVTGAGSLRNLHFAATAPRNATEAQAADRSLLRLLHLKLLLGGIMAAPRGMFAFSTVTTVSEIDLILQRLDEALAWLRPALEERGLVLAGR